MNTALLIGLGVLFILINAGVIWFFLSRKREGGEGTILIQQQIQELSRTVDGKVGELLRTVDTKIGESSKMMHDSVQSQFRESAAIIRSVTEGLAKLDETNRQVVSFADQLGELQDMLKNPKGRGVLGEYYLETLLKNVLPPGSFQMQYNLGRSEDGSDLIVDAAVFVRDKIIPVDSKFSLENYNRVVESRDEAERDKLEKTFVNDLKMRIQETAKYIQPEKGTLEFAFMFIPHEAIYYDLLVNKIGALKSEDTENLIQRAASKYKVIIVSPTSFLAYLQTVLQGLKALQIEDSVKGIIKNVGDLEKHLKTYQEYHIKLGNSLATTINHYNASGKEFRKIDKDVLRITGEAIGIEQVALDGPEREG